MKLQALKKLNLLQWRWLAEAYLRLWPVQVRIRFADPGWLADKVLFSDDSDDSDAASSRADLPTLSSSAELRCRQMHESVRLAARCHLSQPACLPRAIVLADMLTRRNIPAKVSIGVHKSRGPQSELASHAWVEVQGRIIAEPEAISQRFTQINYKKT